MKKATKRAGWILFAGFIANFLTLFAQSVGEFNFNQNTEILLTMIATSLIATITKEINNEKQSDVRG